MKLCSPNPFNLTLNFVIVEVKQLSNVFKRGENDNIEGKHGFFSEFILERQNWLNFWKGLYGDYILKELFLDEPE